jgi:hypothetical protein
MPWVAVGFGVAEATEVGWTVMEFDGVGVEVKVIAGGMVTVMIEERTRKVANGVG